MTNNHFEGKAAVNALQLKSMLTGKRSMSRKPCVIAIGSWAKSLLRGVNRSLHRHPTK